MRVFSAKVRGGSLVTDEVIDLPDGAIVTVVADEAEDTFDVSAEEEERLVEAMNEAERGEVVSAAELLARLHP